MRRLISLLLGSAAVAAAVRIVMRRGGEAPSPPQPSVMPRPTSAPIVPQEEPMPEEPPPSPPADPPEPTADTPGPISEGEPGAITAAPVPEEPEPPPAPDDAELERAVQDKIGEDPAVLAEGVEIDVEGGVARLSGSVPDDETATRLGDDAARVDGIIGLDDNLERGGTAEERPAPAETADEPGEAEAQPRIPGSDPGATRRPVDSPE